MLVLRCTYSPNCILDVAPARVHDGALSCLFATVENAPRPERSLSSLPVLVALRRLGVLSALLTLGRSLSESLVTT